MAEIIYREAGVADAEAVAQLHAESWRAHYRGEYRDEYLDGEVFADRRQVWAERFSAAPDNQYVVVAQDGARLIGFACVYGGEDPRWGSLLDNIHVQPGLQSKGVGTELMKRVFNWCAAHHPDQGLYLWVLQSNGRAQHFYAGLGAQDEGGEWSEPAGGGRIHGRRYVWRQLPGQPR